MLFAPVQGILQNRLYFMMMGLSTVTQHRLKTFPQDYGNEKRVTAQCGGLTVDSDEHGCPQQYLSSTNEDRISYRAHYIDHAITLRIMYSVWQVNVHVCWADDDTVHPVVMTVKLH